MSTRSMRIRTSWRLLLLLAAGPAIALAQVPVDDQDRPIGDFESGAVTGNEDIPLLSATELEEIVGPIALYPDDLLAIVLPASTYPLQVIQAARFLEELERDPSLEPDESWDDSVVALINYPEVVEMLNEDLDWTWRLGEAVVAQQSDVITAIESFRDRAYAAGNLKSDAHQSVTHNDGVIEITPVSEDTIYVPYYEPEHVIVHQPRPVYYYYPRAYPVYYYPYPSGYAFDRGYFWGVTTAFSIGWFTDSLHVFHHSYYGHPYFGHSYWDRWWYRRPTLSVHNHYYVGDSVNVSFNRYRSGDHWRPWARRTVRISDQRITRTRYYPNLVRRDASGQDSGHGVQRFAPATSNSAATGSRADRGIEERVVRNRSNRLDVRDSGRSIDTERSNRSAERDGIRFRDRTSAANIRRQAGSPGSTSLSGRTRDSVRSQYSAPTTDREAPSRPTFREDRGRNSGPIARSFQRSAAAPPIGTERVRASGRGTPGLRAPSPARRATTNRIRTENSPSPSRRQLQPEARERSPDFARAETRAVAAPSQSHVRQTSAAERSARQAPERTTRRSAGKSASIEKSETRRRR